MSKAASRRRPLATALLLLASLAMVFGAAELAIADEVAATEVDGGASEGQAA